MLTVVSSPIKLETRRRSNDIGSFYILENIMGNIKKRINIHADKCTLHFSLYVLCSKISKKEGILVKIRAILTRVEV